MADRDADAIPQERDITDALRTSHETVRHSGTYEATELGRLRSRYSSTSMRRSHPHTTSGIEANEVNGFVATSKASGKKFWRNQVSITVPHATCRDHLGKSALLLYHWRCFISVIASVSTLDLRAGSIHVTAFGLPSTVRYPTAGSLA